MPGGAGEGLTEVGLARCIRIEVQRHDSDSGGYGALECPIEALGRLGQPSHSWSRWWRFRRIAIKIEYGPCD